MTRSARKKPVLIKLTKICLALPEASRDFNGQHAGFTVRKRTFAWRAGLL